MFSKRASLDTISWSPSRQI